MQTIIGAIPSAVIWYLAHRFYVVHPEYIVHNSWALDFSFKRIRLIDLVSFFEDVTPVFWLGSGGILLFPVLIAVDVILFRQKEKQAAIGLMAGIALLFLSVGINKVHDGYPTVFYSWTRIFMGVPLLIALFVSKIQFSKFSMRWWLLLILPVLFFTVKCANVQHAVNREVEGKNEYNMYVGKISKIKQLCETVQALSDEYKVNLIVAGPHFTKHMLSYACPCLQENFPKIIEPSEDRRTWLLKEEDGKIRNSILFVAYWEESFSGELITKYNMLKVSDDPLIFLLKNNNLETSVLLDSLKIPMRKH